ncbi:MAG TPA: hypothetical protein PJ984_04370 [Candidatus Saccharibacteria bacterium]|jgi:hypothetical protein|nr:hypothetical protein [Candidatus Saccharibacteria bacterium]
MKNILKLFPSSATTLSLFILPVLFSIYYVVTKFSDRFITEQEITYFDVQNSWTGQFFVTQTWLEWFNRFMDFALWGMLAAIILILAWFVSSARTALSNHEAVEEFKNFREEKSSWQQNFIIVSVVKFVLVVMMVITFFALLGQAIPLLGMNISSILDNYTLSALWALAYSVLLVVFLQFLLITCVKIFKITRVDD